MNVKKLMMLALLVSGIASGPVMANEQDDDAMPNMSELGIDFESDEWFYGQKAYVTCVKAKHNNIAKQYFLNSGTLALLPLNDKEEQYSIIFCTNSTGIVSEELQELNVKFKLGLDFSSLQLGNGFELKHSRAKSLYIGKTVLCGDAANTFHPMAGHRYQYRI